MRCVASLAVLLLLFLLQFDCIPEDFRDPFVNRPSLVLKNFGKQGIFRVDGDIAGKGKLAGQLLERLLDEHGCHAAYTQFKEQDLLSFPAVQEIPDHFILSVVHALFRESRMPDPGHERLAVFRVPRNLFIRKPGAAFRQMGIHFIDHFAVVPDPVDASAILSLE